MTTGTLIIRDPEFHQSKLVLKGKVKCLRQQGKGKRPNAADALTAEEEKMLWSEQSLGDCSPRVLSKTMWWILTQHFCLKGRQEHHSGEVEIFSFCVDDGGTEYVTFKENPTKTRQGGLNTRHRNALPNMFATGGQRCPVESLLRAATKRSFLPCHNRNSQNKCLIQEQRLSINSIDNIMKSVVKNPAMETSKKKLTNHNGRKTVMKTKLSAASVERQSIIQVIGASEKFLNDYEQRQLSNIISMTPQSAASSNFPGLLKRSFFCNNFNM